MDNQKYYPLSVFTILCAALYYAIVRYFLPELEKQAFDVAASTWFVFSPLYLLAKRLWLVKKLTKKVTLFFDIIFCLAVNGCLCYTAIVSTPEMSMRVYTVWVLNIAIWIAIFKTKKEDVVQD